MAIIQSNYSPITMNQKPDFVVEYFTPINLVFTV